MEEKKKVWIRGRKGRGSEIKGILEGLGAEAKGINCNEGDCIYFINHNNEIDYVPGFGTELAQVIMDNYREIELPAEQWKDGDILAFNKYPGCYAVFKRFCEDHCFEAYFLIEHNGVHSEIHFNITASVEPYHLANAKERKDAFRACTSMLKNLFAVDEKAEK
jgi:hypothetical protein